MQYSQLLSHIGITIDLNGDATLLYILIIVEVDMLYSNLHTRMIWELDLAFVLGF